MRQSIKYQVLKLNSHFEIYCRHLIPNKYQSKYNTYNPVMWWDNKCVNNLIAMINQFLFNRYR